jgi:hypothetical protein
MIISQKVTTVRLIMLASVITTALDAQKYTVHMSRPVRAGQCYAVTATGSRFHRASIGDRVLKAEEYQVDFKGRAEVLEVDRKARPVKIAFTVEKFTKIAGGLTTDLLKSGSVIVADDSQEQPVSLKDGTLEESVREAFDLIYSANKPDAFRFTDDEIFGTKEPKGIGDSWSIDRTLASESLKDTGIIIPTGRLTGVVSLVAKDKIAAIDCLKFRAELTADNFTLKDLPPGVTADRTSMHMIILGSYPIDNSGVSYKEGGEITGQVRFTTNDGVKTDLQRIEKREEVWVAAEN